MSSPLTCTSRAGPSSDGGLLVQSVHDNQAVQVNLNDMPSKKVLFPDLEIARLM
jgi:hypothetical protein